MRTDVLTHQDGYYRFPTLAGDTVVFACEDDLWTVPAAGGVARRLTSNPGQASFPALSPDGQMLAFSGRDEGATEVYCMSAAGGPAHRLTFLGADTRVLGWRSDGSAVVFASNAGAPFMRMSRLYAIRFDGGEPERLPTGPAMSIAYGPGGGAVIGRNTTDIARWKRYRGGLTGDLWVDPAGDGQWRRLIQLAGNVAMPQWLGERIYFVSDHEGIGNIYSCLPSGEDLRRHTHHADYYARNPATDGRRIAYHAGADLYLYDPATDSSVRIPVDLRSPRVQRKRKFVSASRYLQGYAPHPEGHSLAVIARGKTFSMASWEGAVVQHGDADGVRHRLVAWLPDGKRLVVAGDAPGEDALEVHTADASTPPDRLDGLDIGRPVALAASPKDDLVALANHRLELLVVDLASRSVRVLDRSKNEGFYGLAWSPDGKWLAYGFSRSRQTAIIRLVEIATGAVHDVTRPVLVDAGPAWDPDGKYLYFLSYREFNPVYDNLRFDLAFPRGVRPYLVTLQADAPSPFIPVPRAPGDKPKGGEDGKGDDGKGDEAKDDGPKGDQVKGEDVKGVDAGAGAVVTGDGGDTGKVAVGKDGEKKPETPVRIDLDGIADRIVAFPVPEGRYGQIRGIKGQVLFTSLPVVGALGQAFGDDAPKGTLETYRFDDLKQETLASDVAGFEVSGDGKTLVYRSGGRLRVIKAGAKPENGEDAPGRKSGWVDLGRVRVSVDPGKEWEQMFREAWRLQRDHFWTVDMSGVDWQRVYSRYFPLLSRVGTRTEFSDLMWEMQGELGTSHAYEMGGDYPPEPSYDQGLLGADLAYDPATDSFRIEAIVRGDPWDDARSSPLARAGVDVRPGDRLVAVGGRRVGRDRSPGEALVNQAGVEVLLTFARDAEGDGADGARSRTVTVKALGSDRPARYRDWVEANRRRVHEASAGRVGYVHIPDMGPAGYAEFHRGFLAEIDREGLIVDARFNGGGNVSQLILEKLARRRVGYDIQRWGEPMPYPYESVLGPLVALTNEQAGSDGDMFSHVFKMMKLGPLIGKRTWGGVIGINMRNSLVDGGMTTQPEYAFWFRDVGWGLENHGAEPDIEVEIRPRDAAGGADPQLDRALDEILAAMAKDPPRLPEFGARPRLELP
jgi:tricorn protease